MDTKAPVTKGSLQQKLLTLPSQLLEILWNMGNKAIPIWGGGAGSKTWAGMGGRLCVAADGEPNH